MDNFVQFKCMLMFRLENWGLGSSPLSTQLEDNKSRLVNQHV